MKTTIITIAILMTTVYGFAQQAQSGQVTKYVTTFAETGKKQSTTCR
ncbi:MAG: hypothetical protein U5K51_14110 [Flavobacteriaceae bacterium]|nr:hypothetical protein [Flavobacteriaceae bacterium]